mmetsp:Transcript_29468/g.51680  ORF Transcript_29468/g.51680 Transcript_29468/m.51680 type:complete len:160 (+) Transcript_29468:203-682(+)
MLLASRSGAAFQSPLIRHHMIFPNRHLARPLDIRMEEMRIDSDGGAYAQQAFKDFYGQKWQEKWNAAKTVKINQGERRIDNDGGSYTQMEFQKFYGSMWQKKWSAATPDPNSVEETVVNELGFKVQVKKFRKRTIATEWFFTVLLCAWRLRLWYTGMPF